MHTSALAGVLCTSLVVLSGCDDAPPPAAAPSATVAPSGTAVMEPPSQPAARSARARNGRQRPTPDGIRPLLRLIAKELKVEDDQRKKLASIGQSTRTPDEYKKAESALRDALSAGVRAGKLDEGAVGKPIADMKVQMQATQERSAGALDAIHKLLTPTQRGEVVKAVRERSTGRKVSADWLGQESAGGKRGGMAAKRTRGGDGPLGWLSWRRLTRGLGLDREQIAKAKEVMREAGAKSRLAQGKKKQERVAKMITAFAKNDFDATKFLPDENATFTKLETQIAAMRAILPMLDDKKREQLATALERGSGTRRAPPK